MTLIKAKCEACNKTLWITDKPIRDGQPFLCSRKKCLISRVE